MRCAVACARGVAVDGWMSSGEVAREKKVASGKARAPTNAVLGFTS